MPCSGLLVAKSQAVGSKKVESGRLPWGVLGDDACASHAASAQKENLASQRGGLRLDREAISQTSTVRYAAAGDEIQFSSASSLRLQPVPMLTRQI